MILDGQRGFVLLPVVIALTLIAVMALTVNGASALDTSLTARSHDADVARYVAEAGLAQMDWTLQQKNCTDYTSLVAVPFAAHRFDATVSKSSGQPVDLRAVSTTAAGGSAELKRSDVKVYTTTAQSRLIQAGTAAGKETFIDPSDAGANAGGDPRIRVGFQKDRTLVDFPLGDIPAKAKVISARMSLFQTAGQNTTDTATILAHRVTRPWVEGSGLKDSRTTDGATWDAATPGLAWTTPGGDIDPAAAAKLPPGPPSGWRTWNVTDLVQTWVDGTFPNHGMLLIATGNVGTALFVASDDTTMPDKHPKLEITFRALCSATGSPIYQQTLPIRHDAAIKAGFANRNYGVTRLLEIHETARLRALFRADLSGVPAGTKLQGARLRLYVTSMSNKRSGTATTVNLHALTQSWVEGTLNGGTPTDGVTWDRRDPSLAWARPGGDYRAQAASSATLAASFVPPGWMEFDVTALAQEWIDGITPNHGVIALNVSDDRVEFSSREALENQPQLVLTY